MGQMAQLPHLTQAARDKLEIYAALLKRWQAKINLVSNSTLDDAWKRHFLDSCQLLPLAGAWTRWVDLGSGGGFPAMVIAILAEAPEARVHLIESDKRKAAFLREVSRETLTPVEIHVGRIENILPDLTERWAFDIVSARALAPLEQLLAYAQPALKKGATGLFLKGKGLSNELTERVADGSVEMEFFDSQTDSDAKIVVVRWHPGQMIFN